MRNNKLRSIFIVAVILVIAGISITRVKYKKPSDEVVKEVTPFIGSIKTFISSTATVLPKNRLEIKPSVNGRIEQILVREGDKVKTGQILGWMSSTERAALVDAARGKGEESLRYWEETYKPIPLPSPIDAEVIVAKAQPGQTMTTNDAVVVLSDELIVRAQVDETDIGKITPGIKAVVTLDAYPDTAIQCSVEHIYYESKTVNNVTIYEVDLKPEAVPAFFRSGMNASVNFIGQERSNILLIPQEAVHRENGKAYCSVRPGNGAEPLRTAVELGISDEKNVEVISGISGKDRIIVKSKKYNLPKSASGRNPFMPGH